jgi:tetratricopeptide (TPR) repeat protein
MSTRYLAIPFGTFLAVCILFPTFAQVTPVSSDSSQPPGNSVAAPTVPQTSPLSSEEMARLYLVKKQYREAQELFHQLTIQQPKNAVYWNELGITMHSQSDLNMALKCYQKASKLDAHYPDAVNNMGTIFYERKKYSKAIRSYKKAIGIRNDFAPFYLNLGYAYFAQKSYEDSIGAFRKALQLDPLAFEVNRSRTGTIIQDRSLNTERGRFYFMLAKSFAEAGDVERCLIYLRKARDEGYKEMNTVKSDPSFAAVLKNPDIQEVLAPKAVLESEQP